ncbi:MAG TPA: geranylgeranylglycerol-phosphate geranylgeranyltransferase [Bacteroidota bacterium]|nr:geranylgeranylglycerol-phosphate geranylgeranyltransferase [Bacteroidota bacterium]
MPSKKLVALVDLTRPVNVAITLVSIPAASVLAGAGWRQWFEVLLAALTGGLVAGAANAINDRFDADIDRINKPSRPIPRGDATQRDALIEWSVLSLIAIALNVALNVYAIGIVISAVAILYWYSAYFKRTVLAGNFIVGFMTGTAFIYGAVVVGNVERALMPAIFAFLANFAREILKDIEDIEGDRKEGAATLPVRYGIQPARIVASFALVLLVAATVVAYQLGIYTIVYLYIVLVVDVLLAAVLVWMWIDLAPASIRKMSSALKASMVIGLVAIFLGSGL